MGIEGSRAPFARLRFVISLSVLAVALGLLAAIAPGTALAANPTIPTSGVESYNAGSPYAGLVISSFDPYEGNTSASTGGYLSQTWVQLFNGGSQPVNLNGLSVQDFGGTSLLTDEWGAAGSATGGPIELGANANGGKGFSTPVGTACTTGSGPVDQTGCLQPGQYYLLGSAWNNAAEGGDATADLPMPADQTFSQQWKPGVTTAPAPYLSTSAYALLVDGTNDLQTLSSTMSWPQNGDAGIIDAIATSTNFTAGTTPVWGGQASNGAAPGGLGRTSGDQMLQRQGGGCVNTGDNTTDWMVGTVEYPLPTTLQATLDNSSSRPSPCPDATTRVAFTSVPQTVAPGAQFTVKVAGEDADGAVVAGDGVPNGTENTAGTVVGGTNPAPSAAVTSQVTLSDTDDDSALTCVDANNPGTPSQDATAEMYHGYATFTCTINPQSGDSATVDLRATEAAAAEGGFPSPTVTPGTSTLQVSDDAPQPLSGSWDGLIIDSVSGDGSYGTSASYTGYKYDYVDLFDSGADPVSLQGLSLQLCTESGQRTNTNNQLAALFGWPSTAAASQQTAGSCTSTVNSVLALPDVILQPGQHFLVAAGGHNEYTGTAITNYSDLPTIPDEDWGSVANNYQFQVVLVDGTAAESDNAAGTFVSPADTNDPVSATNDFTGLAEPVLDSFTGSGENATITEPAYDPGVTWIEGEVGPYLRDDLSAERLSNGCLNTQNNGYDFNGVLTLSVPSVELQDMSGTIDPCPTPAKLAFRIEPPSTTVPTADMQNAFTVQVVSQDSNGQQSAADNDTTGTLTLEQDAADSASGLDTSGVGALDATAAKLSCVQVSGDVGDYITGQTTTPATTPATDQATGVTSFHLVGGSATLDCSVDTDGQGYSLTASGSSTMYGPLLSATSSQFTVADPTQADWSSSSTNGLVVSEAFMGGGFYDAEAGHEGDNGYWPYSFIELQNDGDEPISLAGLSVQQFGVSSGSGHANIDSPTTTSLTATIPNDLNVNDSEEDEGLPAAIDLRDVTLAPGQHYLVTADISKNEEPAGFYDGNRAEPIGDQNDMRYSGGSSGDSEEGELVAIVDGQVPMPRVDLQDPPVNPATGAAQPIIDSLTDSGSANGHGIVVPGITYSTGFPAHAQPGASEGYGYTRAAQGCQNTSNNVLDFSLTWSSNITPLGMNAANVDCPAILAPGTVQAGLVIAAAYGGGGQSSAYYSNDFVELENAGTTPVSLIGKAVEWIGGDGFTENPNSGNVDENTEPLVPNATDNGCTAATTGPVTQTGCLQPGQYFLVAGGGAGGGDDLSLSPSPDQSDPNFNINWPSTSETCSPNPSEVPAGQDPSSVTTQCDGGGLVLLTDTTQQLNATDLPSPDVLDALGVGGPSWSEGSALSTPSDADAEFRNSNGCRQSDNNAIDFTEADAQHATLFNSNSPVTPCPPPSNRNIYAFGYTPSPSSVNGSTVTTLGEFSNPAGIAIGGPDGTTYVSDTLANEVLTLPFPTNSAIATPFAGQAQAHGDNIDAPGDGDGGAATDATLDKPSGLAVDAAGNVFIADTSDETIREVDASTGDIQTIAGTGTAGYSGDGGQATSAKLNQPIGLAVYQPKNGDETLYVADSLNDVIRAIDLNSGVITTVAGRPGTGGYGGDGGPAKDAELNMPEGLAVDAAGDLFIADSGNNVIRELLVDPDSGIADGASTIRTVAGDYGAYAAGGYRAVDTGNGGPATAAQLNDPQAIAVDPAGDLFIADTYDNAIREVDSSTGDISLVSDSPPVDPEGLAVDPATGDLFVASSGDNTVTLVLGADVRTTPSGGAGATPAGVLTISGAPHGRVRSGSRFTVTVSDGNSADSSTTVGLTLLSPAGVLAPTDATPGTLSCGTSNTTQLSGGSATFTCTVTGPGSGYELEASTAAPTTAYLAPAESAPFDIAYPLSRPERVTAHSTDARVTLDWSPVRGATEYDVYEATASGAELFSNPNDTTAPGSQLANAPVATVRGRGHSTVSLDKLDDGQPYDFQVVAVGHSGRSMTSREVSATPVATPSITGTTPGGGSVTVSWSPAEGATGYTVLVSTTPHGELGSKIDGCSVSGATTTSCTVTGLRNGTRYYFAVEATNDSGASPLSSEVQAVPDTVADAPTGVAGQAGDGEVTVSWNASDDEGSPVTGYSVYAATSSGGEDTSGSAACVTNSVGKHPPADSCVIRGLTNGTTEYFEVIATNAAGDSAPSQEVSATPSTVPDAPTGLRAAGGDGDVQLSWAAPTNDGGSPITRYEAYDALAPGAERLLGAPPACVESGATNTSCTVVLDPGVQYYFVVVAINANGASTVSGEAHATPTVDPGAPSGVAATAGTGEVDLTWNAPTNPESPVSGYSVYQSRTSGAENLSGTPACTATTSTSCEISHLVNGTTYHFVVVVNLQSGASDVSTEVSATPIAVATDVRASAANGQATVSWTAAAGATSYEVLETTAAGQEALTGVEACSTARTSCIIRGLDGGTTYYFVVVASNSTGTAAASSEVSARPVATPSAPTGVTVTPGDGSLSVSWSAPASDGGAAVHGYDVFISTTAGGENLTGRPACSTTNATTCQVTGLQNGTTYHVVATASNTVGASGASSEASATPSTVPDAPAQVQIDPGADAATVGWSAPASDGGSAVTGYEVFAATSAGGEDLHGTPVCSTTRTSCTAQGLIPGKAYYFVVVATNVNGVSVASHEVHLTAQASTDTTASGTATAPGSSAGGLAGPPAGSVGSGTTTSPESNGTP